MTAPLPSGRQFELSFGTQHAVVTEVGATLRGYEVGGVPVIAGFAADAMCSGGRGQPLLPWPNRIRDGLYKLDGAELQLALTDPGGHHAIHGLVRWLPWTLVEHEAAHVALACVVHPQPGYPFTLELRLDYRLDADGLRIDTQAHNTGTRACPFGAGFHPYLDVGGDNVDGATLELSASEWMRTDLRLIPAGRVGVTNTAWDFRQPRVIGPQVLDHTFTTLTRDGDGRAKVRLSSGGRATTLWMDERFHFVQVFTGETLEPARRRRALAVEPMTCAPDAFNSGEGLVMLAPGERFAASWGLSPR
jgi:aldose 1-epimerase